MFLDDSLNQKASVSRYVQNSLFKIKFCYYLRVVSGHLSNELNG